MSAEEPGPCRSWVEKPRGLEACIDIVDGVLITRNLEVEFADVVLETSDPAGLLCMAVTGFLFTLADELRELLDKVSNFCRARTRKRGADHSNDGRSEGA